MDSLIKPQVIPPLERNQVTEPQVRSFVRDGANDGELGCDAAEDFVAEEARRSSGDETPVLHGTDAECIADEKIELAEWVRNVEKLQAGENQSRV